MADRTRVPSNLPKYTGKRGEDVREWPFQIENACRINNIPVEDTSSRLPGIAGSAMEKPASGWFLHWSSTTREEEHTWGIFREHVLQHFVASNYQSVLREKLQRLKQTSDIETYNGEYSATRTALSHAHEATDLTVKYKVTHFVDEVRDRQARQDKRRPSVEQGSSREKSFKGKPFRGKGLFKPRPDSKRAEDRTGFHCKKPGHIKANCFLWKKEQGKQGNGQPRQ
ncbi:hypothetical protein PC112_g5162 [Phytophthora cactorum]|nr:hypothetical protein PC112_g5162 [Phytophthora cactorum]